MQPGRQGDLTKCISVVQRKPYCRMNCEFRKSIFFSLAVIRFKKRFPFLVEFANVNGENSRIEVARGESGGKLDRVPVITFCILPKVSNSVLYYESNTANFLRIKTMVHEINNFYLYIMWR